MGFKDKSKKIVAIAVGIEGIHKFSLRGNNKWSHQKISMVYLNS